MKPESRPVSARPTTMLSSSSSSSSFLSRKKSRERFGFLVPAVVILAWSTIFSCTSWHLQERRAATAISDDSFASSMRSEAATSKIPCSCVHDVGNGMPPKADMIGVLALSVGSPKLLEKEDEDEKRLSECARRSKERYANTHGYKFFDDRSFTPVDSIPLPRLTILGASIPQNAQQRMRKLQFLIQMMDRHRDIEWFLWTGHNAVLKDQTVTVQDNLQLFNEMHQQQHSRSPSIPTLSLVIAMNHHRYNDDFFLVRNNEIGRRIVYHNYMEAVDLAEPSILVDGLLKKSNKQLLDHVLELTVDQATSLQSYLANPYYLLMTGAKIEFRKNVLTDELHLCQDFL